MGPKSDQIAEVSSKMLLYCEQLVDFLAGRPPPDGVAHGLYSTLRVCVMQVLAVIILIKTVLSKNWGYIWTNTICLTRLFKYSLHSSVTLASNPIPLQSYRQLEHYSVLSVSNAPLIPIPIRTKVSPSIHLLFLRHQSESPKILQRQLQCQSPQDTFNRKTEREATLIPTLVKSTIRRCSLARLLCTWKTKSGPM